ncbi:MAG: hypothetical protein ACRCWA_07205 [Clostridium butyricum]
MCEYCDFRNRKTAFSNEFVKRGKLLAGDCDIDAYIFKEEYIFKKDVDFSIRLESYNGYESGFDINYCPMCGRKLK